MNSFSELEKENIKSAEQDMSQQEEPSNQVIDEEQVTINYLKNHPDFFVQHASLITELEVPHASGSAVSLIERQVGLLREQNAQHKVHLAELVEIAKENEQSNQRLHKLILSLLDCREMDACEVVLDEIICDDFSVDAVSLKLFLEPVAEQPEHLFIENGSKLALELEKLLNKRKPMCGFFKNLPLDELFDEKAHSLTSLAVLPLFIEKNHCFGALILGSNNVRRFSADMGTVFLERLAEILSHVLNSFIGHSK